MFTTFSELGWFLCCRGKVHGGHTNLWGIEVVHDSKMGKHRFRAWSSFVVSRNILFMKELEAEWYSWKKETSWVRVKNKSVTVPQLCKQQWRANMKFKLLLWWFIKWNLVTKNLPCCYPQTFVIISSRYKAKHLNRFTATRSLFIFAPWNPVRRVMLTIATNQLFDVFIFMTIMVNCVFLAMPTLQISEKIEWVL